MRFNGIGAYAVDIVVTTHVAHAWEGLADGCSILALDLLDRCFADAVDDALCSFRNSATASSQTKARSASPQVGVGSSTRALALHYCMARSIRDKDWIGGAPQPSWPWSRRAHFSSSLRQYATSPAPNPLLNFPFLRRRNVVLLAFVLIFFRFLLLSAVVIVPSYLGTIQSYNAQQIGPVLLWLAVPELLAGFLAVYLLERIDVRIHSRHGVRADGTWLPVECNLSSDWSGTNFQVSQLVLSLGEGLAFNGLVGTLVLDILNSGAMERGIDLLTFSGFFQTIRLLGGEVGSTFMQFFLQRREQFHSNILGLHVQAGSTETNQRLLGLTAGMRAKAATPDEATGRAIDLLGLTIRKQAFTLAVTDCFLLLACAAMVCLIVISCVGSHKLQYKNLIASLKGTESIDGNHGKAHR